MYIYRDIYTYSPMLQLHSSYKRTPKRWQPLFVLYAITFSGPLGTDLRCINPCDRSNPHDRTPNMFFIQDASGAHDRPRRPEGLSIGTFRAQNRRGIPLEKWCPESWTNGHLRICFSSSKRLTWWYQPIYDIYIYVCIGRVKVYEMICIQTYWVIYIHIYMGIQMSCMYMNALYNKHI